MKKALITGITGQDGSYLAELLLEKGYEVHGITRALSRGDSMQVFSRATLYEADITDEKKMCEIVMKVRPDEVYDLAAIVDPLVSFESEYRILHNNLSGIHILLGAIKEYAPSARCYFAASSLVFGNPDSSPQNENAPKNPVTPYGIAKAAGCNLVKMYRDVYGIFACAGILYNHESPRRNPRFLPRKITKAAARIKKGLQNELVLGDIEAIRDWGFAGDYVKSMWLMLQQEKPEDYVIGTGEGHSVRELLDVAFGHLGLDWSRYVKVDKGLLRARESHLLIADSRKARERLGWSPSVNFTDLVTMMVEADIKEVV